MDRAGATPPRRLRVFSADLASSRSLRRILAAAGERVSLGWPRDGDAIALRAGTPGAMRAARIAARTGAPLLTIEDAWLGLHDPGRGYRNAPLGLLLDRSGAHYDPRQPSDLETLLATHPLDDAALLTRARHAIARIRRAHLSARSAVDPALPAPDPGYVLVVDQPRGDPAAEASGADRARFVEMLVFAQEEHPGARVVIRTARGGEGHFGPQDLSDRVSLCAAPLSPWVLLDGAVAVYTLSAQLGFEAILAGHRPRVFGQPFYAGWGLTQDDAPVPRRERRLTRAQLFAGAALLYPVWYDPVHDARGEIEVVIGALEAQARAWREDGSGWIARRVPAGQRGHVQRAFGTARRVRFVNDARRADALAARTGRRVMARAEATHDGEDVVRLGSGHLAGPLQPTSLVIDDIGIHDDPRRPSRLERLIADSADLPEDAEARARQLIRALSADFARGAPVPPLPEGHRILVPGDCPTSPAIHVGSPEVTSETALLARVREANPDAVLIYAPPPGATADLARDADAERAPWADVVLDGTDPSALLADVNEVWTMRSRVGFEALLRGLPVTTLGAPVYAGWGLTRDLGTVPARRLGGRRPSLEGLVHAALVAYPRYVDPVTGLPCPVEVAIASAGAEGMPGRSALAHLLSQAARAVPERR